MALEQWTLTETPESADWLQAARWELPPFGSPEFDAVLALSGLTLEAFRRTPTYQGAVKRGEIVDDTWVKLRGWETKFNPRHDAAGRFASSGGGGSHPVATKPTSQAVEPSSGPSVSRDESGGLRRLKALGVEAHVHPLDPPDRVNRATSWVADAVERHGLKVPCPVTISSEGISDHGYIAIFDPGNPGHRSPQIQVNPMNHLFGDPQVAAQAWKMQADTHWLATTDHGHPLIHEMGHAAMFAKDERAYKALPDVWGTRHLRRPGFIDAVANGVSGYAAEGGPHEFLAEVWAGRAQGQTYGEAINRIYRELKGPANTHKDAEWEGA